MMEFKNNEGLSFEDRVKQVSKEITNYYPEIYYDVADKIASLCDTITKDNDYSAIFNRYYYILLYTLKREVFNNIFKDMVNTCSGKTFNETYINIFADLIKYYNGEIGSFPMISDYYN